MNEKTLELQIKIIAEQALAQVKALSGDLKELAANAKTFAEDSNAVTRTLQKYQKDAASTASSFKLFGASSAEVRHQQELAKKSAVELVNAGLKPESQEVQNLVAQYKKLGAQADEIDKANGGNIKSFGDLKSAVTQTAAAVALIKTVDKVKDITSFALTQADAFQTARNEFGILLGDMEAGAGLFNEIKAFNDKTPFSLDTTKQAVNVLLSADVPLTQINERLRQFGDLSQGNSQRFSSYVDAFSKAAAKGKVDMQVLNTYMNQGVPILKELAAGFGVTQEEIMDMVSKGQVSFRDFSSALERLTAEGGKYFGGMELGSKSLAAMQEGLKESVNALAASYGTILMPVQIKQLEIFTSLINLINESAIAKGVLAGLTVGLTVTLTIMAVKMTQLAAKTWLAQAAQMALNAAKAVGNPLMIAGIVAATAATVAIVAYASAQQNAANKANDAALAAKSQADAYNNAAVAARNNAEALNEMGAAAQNNLIQKTQQEIKNLEIQREQLIRVLNSTPKEFNRAREKRTDEGVLYIERYSIANPAWAEYKKQVDSITLSIHQANENLMAFKNKQGELKISTVEAFGTEWQDKLKTGLEALNAEQDKAIEALKKKAQEIFKEGYEDNAAYEKELDALREYFRRKRNDLNKKDIAELGRIWQDKMASGMELIENEYKKSLEELQKKASDIFGRNYKEQAAYKAELFALEEYYENKKRNFERDTIMNAHNLRMENFRKEWELQRALARRNIEQGDFGKSGKFIISQFMSNSGGSQFGELFTSFSGAMGNAANSAQAASGAMEGAAAGASASGSAMQGAAANVSAAGAVWLQLLIALINATMELENFKKSLNWADTVVDKIFETIGPMLNEHFAVFSEPLEEAGRAIGQILAPLMGIIQILAAFNRIFNTGLLLPLILLGTAFEWFYNNVIYPFGNAIIRIINDLIDLINEIPGVNIKKINYLQAIGDMAEELAKEMERRKEEITKMYERQKDRVRDELTAQLSSIRQQYELGLMSRADYEKQAEAYQSAADLKLIDINEEMKQQLEQIEKNTRAVITPEQQKIADDTYNFLTDRTVQGTVQTASALIDPITTGIVSTVTSAVEGDWLTAGLNVITGGLYGGIKKIFGFSTGTPFVPHDMIANIHQGEGIIPRTFNDGIRSGEYALVGRGNKNRTSERSINVNVTVTGSVVTERELTSVIYKGIAEGIKAGDFTPMPA